MSRYTLIDSWRGLMIQMGIKADFLKTFYMFEDAYGASGRHYHTLEHIDACLAEFAPMRLVYGGVPELAIWFHDFVYDNERNDNEEESARRAEEFCHASGISKYASTVSRLVLATKHSGSDEPLPDDAALLVDIDLSILGKPEEVYRHYEHQIRREYSSVPEHAFRQGRKRLLLSFLEKQTIYRTPYFRDKYENQARSNLRWSLECLQSRE